MTRAKWSPEEMKRLRELAAQGLTSQQIYDSGELKNRSMRAIDCMVSRSCATQKNFLASHVKAKGIADLKEIVELFVEAFRQLCSKTEWSRDELERYKILFQAASKYRDLFAAFEEVKQLDERLAALEKLVKEIQGKSKV